MQPEIVHTQSLATLVQRRLFTRDEALNASSLRDELIEMMARGAGVVPGAGLNRPGAPQRPPVR